MDIETSQDREIVDLPDDDPPAERGKPQVSPEMSPRGKTVPRGGEVPRDTTAESRTGDEDFLPRDPTQADPPSRGQEAHQGDPHLTQEPAED